MSVNKPTQADESLSAYLDGELHGDELARVERLINSNAEYRQLADDLRRIRAQLEQLPRHRLAEDFSSVVLRQAEREMLKPADGADSDDAPLGSPKSPGIVDRGWWRGIVWATTAVAAALLVGLVVPRIQRDVSVKDQRESQLAKVTAANSASSEIPTGQTTSSAYEATESSNESRAGDLAQESFRDSIRSRSARSLSSTKPVEDLSVDAVATEPMSEDRAVNRRSRYANKRESTHFERENEEIARRMKDIAEPDAHRHQYGKMEADELPSQPEMVVTVNVPLEVFHQRRFDESLAKNDIYFSHDDVEDRKKQQRNRYLQRDFGDFEDLDDAKEMTPATTPESAPSELIYVKATRAQIEATLHELQQYPQQYTQVAVQSEGKRESMRGRRFESDRSQSSSSGRRDLNVEALRSLGYVGAQAQDLPSVEEQELSSVQEHVIGGGVTNGVVDEGRDPQPREPIGKARRIGKDKIFNEATGRRAMALDEDFALPFSRKSRESMGNRQFRPTENRREGGGVASDDRAELSYGGLSRAEEKDLEEMISVLFIVKVNPGLDATSRSTDSDQSTPGQ